MWNWLLDLENRLSVKAKHFVFKLKYVPTKLVTLYPKLIGPYFCIVLKKINQTKNQALCVEIWCFWPLTASTTSEVKNDHTHIFKQGICNKFIEVNFCVEHTVWWPNRICQDWTFVKYWWDERLASVHFFTSKDPY